MALSIKCDSLAPHWAKKEKQIGVARKTLFHTVFLPFSPTEEPGHRLNSTRLKILTLSMAPFRICINGG